MVVRMPATSVEPVILESTLSGSIPSRDRRSRPNRRPYIRVSRTGKHCAVRVYVYGIIGTSPSEVNHVGRHSRDDQPVLRCFVVLGMVTSQGRSA